ncbi:MAG TPA: acyl-CoA dehydrogenase family protein [Bryobacteraceae bacterium]|nr:acyl-CoA dehydrogenase family protein [Bryobacteraceae bacterium]
MNVSPTPEQRRWVEIAESVAKNFVEEPRSYDEAASFPLRNYDQLRQAGLLKLAVPRAYGGEGEPSGNAHLTCYLVTEAVSRVCPTMGWNLIIHYHQCGAVARLGNQEQKKRILSDVADGAVMGSLGSEVNHQQVKAASVDRKLVFAADMRPTEGGFLCSASKHFCSNGPIADYLMYWSIAPGAEGMADGLTLSVVTKGSKGLTFIENGWDEMIGLRGTVSWSAKMEDVFVPWKNVLGQPGDFIQKDPYTLELSQSFHLLGSAQGAFDYILKVLRDRPFLQKEEGLMVIVGEMAASLQAARGSCMLANHLWEEERFGDAAAASLLAQHTAREAALTISTKGFDLVGTRALLKTAPLERVWRDIRTATLHTRHSQLIKLAADAVVAGEFAPKQKYGRKLDQPKIWTDFGLTPDAAEQAA